MYPNLKAEMARNGISRDDVAKAAEMSGRAVDTWTGENAEMKVGTALKLHEQLFPSVDFSYLFEFVEAPAGGK